MNCGEKEKVLPTHLHTILLVIMAVNADKVQTFLRIMSLIILIIDILYNSFKPEVKCGFGSKPDIQLKNVLQKLSWLLNYYFTPKKLSKTSNKNKSKF